jgi:predicted nuclease of predicted toxin-antitoxin system
VKLLFDQNVSHQLVPLLADLFPASSQVRPLGLDRADDGRIWGYAKIHGFTLVSQDADFAERSRLHGSPPKLIWLRCGNATTTEVERLLRQNADLILELERNPKLDFLEIS